MPIGTSRMTSKGQVTIPADLRAELGLKPHDRVEFKLVNGALVVKKAESPIDRLFGILKGDGPPPDWRQLREEFEEHMANEGMKGMK